MGTGNNVALSQNFQKLRLPAAYDQVFSAWWWMTANTTMAKRFKEDGAFAGTPSKRLRLDDGVSKDNYAQSGHEPSKRTSKDQEGYSKEEIKDSQQLRKLLAFDQDLPKMRHGMCISLAGGGNWS